MSVSTPPPGEAAAIAPALGQTSFALAKGPSPKGSFSDLLRSALRAPGHAPLQLAPSKGVAASSELDRSPVSDDTDDVDLLHPAARQAAHLGLPAATFVPLVQAPSAVADPSPVDSTAATRAFASLEEIVPALVRKIAWSGDARRGSVRLELGAGALSGATLLVHADGAQVRVALRVPGGADLDAWRVRIAARLAARGLDVSSVEVE